MAVKRNNDKKNDFCAIFLKTFYKTWRSIWIIKTT